MAAFGWIALAPLLAASPESNWLRLRSAHFELLTDAGERAGRETLAEFERLHTFFTQMFTSGLPNAKPVRLIIFRSDDEYAAYRPVEGAAAYYHRGQDFDSIVTTAAKSENRQVAVHEYAHLMIHQSGSKIPLWFDEGMAELFSSVEPHGDGVLIGRPIPSRVRELMQGEWIDVAEIAAMRQNSELYRDPARVAMFYAESWLLVHMLNLSPAYQSGLQQFNAALSPNDLGEAFEKAYGKSLGEVNADLVEYSRRRSVKTAVIPVRLPKNVDAATVEGSADFDARLALAQLLAEVADKKDEARAAYEKLERDYPGKWQVDAEWGRFELRQRNINPGVQRLAKAVELGCNDARVYRIYGEMVSADRVAGEVVPALRSAIARNPESQALRLEFGVALVRAGNWKDGLAELNRIANAPVEDAPRYYYHLAYANFRLGSLATARAALEKGKAAAKTPQERSVLEALEQELDKAR
jgi:hypothetical protein